MMISRRHAVTTALSLLGTSALHPARAEWGSQIGGDIEGLDGFREALEAYIYAYPLVTMEMTRRVMTNVSAPDGTHAPMGQFARVRTYPDASFRDVTAPNADTLYTTAWIDVGKEPWVLSIPDMKGRYFLFPMLDGWTNVFQVPGSRTTATAAQTYAITGPGWTGKLPAGLTEYKSPTNMVWLLGRIYCTGTPEDYVAVHAEQDACALVPLSSFGKPWTPPTHSVDPVIDMKTAVRAQVSRMSAVEYFALFAELLKTNPPAAADRPILPKLAKIGIVPGQSFDRNRFNPDFAARLPQLALDRIMLHFRFSDGDEKERNGWSYTLKTGLYGTDYLQRALVTAIGLGANRPQDAIYPVSQVDSAGSSYDGSHKYAIRFPKGQMPPAKGFWSITMYDKDYFFVPNVLNRYSISERQNLQVDRDGSVTIYLQKDSPGPDKESNWLPAPADKFILMMRLYWPEKAAPSIFNGSWKPPAVVRERVS